MLLQFIHDNYYVGTAISSILLGESFILLIGDVHLIGLHIYLKIKGLTTYEYIVEIRKKNRNVNDEVFSKHVVPEKISDTDISRTIPGNVTIDGNKAVENSVF